MSFFNPILLFWRAVRPLRGVGVLAAAACLFTPSVALGLDQFRYEASSSMAECKAVDTTHAPLSAFLRTYGVPAAQSPADNLLLIAYGKVQDADAARLDAYIEGLTENPPFGCVRDAQMVYWINLYNALTIKVVLDAYPVASIRDIGSWPNVGPRIGPWQEEMVTVDGVALSLDGIEHGILRPFFRDNRVHYAVNCASYSCPSLLPRAWQEATLEEDLATAERAYLSSSRGVQEYVDRVVVSSIFDWYGSDFASDEMQLRQYLAAGDANSPSAHALLSGRTIEFSYDWRLNDPAQIR